jgi:hypothetical protein
MIGSGKTTSPTSAVLSCPLFGPGFPSYRLPFVKGRAPNAYWYNANGARQSHGAKRTL